MYVIERNDPTLGWVAVGRSKYVRIAVADFLDRVGLFIDVADVAHDVRLGCSFEGISTQSGLPLRLRDERRPVTSPGVIA